MRTEYDAEPHEAPRQVEQAKKSKRERRAIAAKKARERKCGECRHAIPDHVGLFGAERALYVWCHVCDHKCERGKEER